MHQSTPGHGSGGTLLVTLNPPPLYKSVENTGSVSAKLFLGYNRQGDRRGTWVVRKMIERGGKNNCHDGRVLRASSAQL